jgi:hypothetical protein
MVVQIVLLEIFLLVVSKLAVQPRNVLLDKNLLRQQLQQHRMDAQTAEQANGLILDPKPVATLSLVLLANIRRKQLQHQLLTDAPIVV